MKSDACSGMNSKVNTLTNTVNGFSSSINDHESRIIDLELSSGGLYKAASFSTWADLYLPSSTTGTLCRLYIHATNEKIPNNSRVELFNLINNYGFSIVSTSELKRVQLGGDYSVFLSAGLAGESKYRHSIVIGGYFGEAPNANVFNGTYNISIS